MPEKISSGRLHWIDSAMKMTKKVSEIITKGKKTEKVKKVKPEKHLRPVDSNSIPEKNLSSQKISIADNVRQNPQLDSSPAEDSRPLAPVDHSLETHYSPPFVEALKSDIKPEETKKRGVKDKLFNRLAKLTPKNKENKKQLSDLSEEKKQLKKEIKECKSELDSLKEKDPAKSESARKIKEQLVAAQKKMEEVKNKKDHLREEEKEDLENKGSLFKFFFDFATSLRDLYKGQKAGQEAKKPTDLRRLTIPKMTIDSPDGPIELRDLELELTVPDFKPLGNKEWQPVFGIKHAEAKVTIPVRGKAPLMVKAELKNLKCQIKAPWGKNLHDYVCNESGTKAAWNALKLLRQLHQLKPEDLSIEGETASLTLLQGKAESLSTLLEETVAAPVSTVDTLFETLGFPISLKLSRMTIDTHGDLSMSAEINSPQVHYEVLPPSDEQFKQNKQQRHLSFAADNGSMEVRQGYALAEKFLAELSVQNPFEVLQGQQQSLKGDCRFNCVSA